jgi:hypothetical protein
MDIQDIKETINQFIDTFPELKPILQEHYEFNEELLPHVLFGKWNNLFLTLIREGDPGGLDKLFNLFESMTTSGDKYVRELLSVTILERLGDDKEILYLSIKHMGKETRKASEEIEKFWGRD